MDQICRRPGIAAWALVLSVVASVAPGQSAQADSVGPVIDVWYGSPQTFGTPGLAQRWINVLGNVSDVDGISSLTYSLNGAAAKNLSRGPDSRRLLKPGDFNVEIDFADLQPGANQVQITARDGAQNQSITQVQVNYVAGAIWPLPTTINWAGISNVQSVAQVIDGEWTTSPLGLESPVMGYDRVIGVGDIAWTNYEVKATITLHAIDPAGFNWPSVSPGFGLTMRWNGHTNNPVTCAQPHCGWKPAGGGLWYDAGHNGPMALFGDETLYITRNQTLTFGVPYVFRVHGETQSDGRIFYALKAWPEGTTEPAAWQLSGFEPPSDVLGGSVILVAHHVDITIHDVSVTPLGSTGGTAPQISSVQVTRRTDSATIAWTTNEPTTGSVRFGTSIAYTGGIVPSGSSGTNHSVQLTGLAAATTYHFQISATDADSNTTQTPDATFVTLAAADTTPPVISNVQASASAVSAVITWTTDEPATSRVDYGPTTTYNANKQSQALTTAHQLTLTGLAPQTQYHYQVTSVDGAGNAVSSSDRTFSSGAAPASALVTDQFEAAALNTGVWTFVNPLGDASVTMTGTQVSLNLPVTTADHEIWYDVNTAPRILQQVEDVDFEFEVKFDSPLTQDLQIQGVAIEEDAINVVRAEFHYLGGVRRIYVASIFDGGFRTHRHQVINVSGPMYLRVLRAGNQFTVSYSGDGANFTTAASFSQPMVVNAVGIHMGASAGVAFSAVADYFLDLSEPLPDPPGDDCNNNGVDDADEIASGDAEDCNNTDVPDECELAGNDCDNNSVPDECDPDCNGDGVPDACTTAGDCNANGVPDSCEPDGDADGTIDACDVCPADPAKTAPGTCGCGVADTDGDADGVANCIDNCPTTANPNQADCDSNGQGDACAAAEDCNENGVPDTCDIADGNSDDADDNGVPDECEESESIFETGTVAVGTSRKRVDLVNTYVNPVVVCTVNYNANSRPVVVRVRNVTPTSFELRLQNPSGWSPSTETVSYIVMEEGAWIIDGVRCEAQRYNSTVTDQNNAWTGQRRTYLQTYNQPVVLGQVMTENNSRWSVFWCCGSSRTSPPSKTVLTTGKTVGEDPIATRSAETVGFIVFEAGRYTLDGVAVEARLGTDSVRGIGNSPPYAYTYSSTFPATPTVLLATQAGMDDSDGSWACTYRTASTTKKINLVIDEDQMADSERNHSTEQVGYVAFRAPMAVR